MCIAVYKPADKVISDTVLEACYKSNKDGCGYANIINGTINMFKTLSFDEFMESYRQAEDQTPDSPFLIHFRIRTHGDVDVDNCHPFQIDDDHVFIHNGVIRNAPEDTMKKKSDTRMFNNHVLRQLPAGWLDNEAIKDLVEEYIGASKLAIMNTDGHVELYNESLGNWDSGIWYSNYGWRPVVKTYSSGYNGRCNSQKDKKKATNWLDVDRYWDEHSRQYKYWCAFTRRWVPYVDYDFNNNKSKTDKQLEYTPDERDAMTDCELSKDELNEVADSVGIPYNVDNFELEVIDFDGETVVVKISRCHHCAEIDYSQYIHDCLLEEYPMDLCEDCMELLKYTHGCEVKRVAPNGGN